MGFLTEFFQNYNYMLVPAALLTIILHEIAHGYTAYLLGDPTAKRQGRFSLNPLRHIDWLGLIMLVIFKMGWAKPVQVDIRYFRHPKRDFALTALAGPVMNFLLALISVLFLFIFAAFGISVDALTAFLVDLAIISIGLGLFNLIPIPPLDGSKVLGAFLPDRIYYQVLRFERYGMIVLFLVLYSGILDGARSTALSYTLYGMIRLFGFLFGEQSMVTVFLQFFA